MKSDLPKPLHKVGGVALVGHVIRIMRIAGVNDITVVVSAEMADSDELESALLPNVSISIQTEQLGTADAMKSARASVESADSVVVAPSDMILVTDQIVRQMIALHEESDSNATVLGAVVDDASGLGRIKLDASGQPTAILEEHEADEELLQSNLINTSWYCFDNDWIWGELDSIEAASTGEVYLPRVVGVAAASGHSRVIVSEDSETGMGVNDRNQLSLVEAVTRRRTNEAHMRSGVTITDPDATYIDIDVEIGADTTIAPGSHIGTRSKIGSGAEIGPNAQISMSTIGDRSVIDGARVVDSTIGEGVTVGTNAVVRGGSKIMTGAKVGNLAEVKNSTIGSGTSVSHFSYIGDATVGEKVNIGAGTVTCNYDGTEKHPTIIEDGALIGSSTMLIAPIRIGKAARTGAGSVVRVDVVAGDTVAGVPAKSIKSE